ncbi:DsbA family oxidoreductase [Roseomonas sp. CCTCC AB2023176]|uniref:DsbA family oxidoreductase n=1 Tax=Roseomonas sp. CCTCC AB2023176 TaxID=3342640 RepID=UPI0035DFB21A
MPDAPHPLLVVSDTICPWCWIGKRRLDAAIATLAAEGLHFERRWHPFLLNPDMPPGGIERAEYRRRKFGSAERSAALDARVAGEGAKEGLAFRFDRIARTPDTRGSHRLIRWATEVAGPAAADTLAESLFRAYFEEGRDIGDPVTLAAIAGIAGRRRRRRVAGGRRGTRGPGGRDRPRRGPWRRPRRDFGPPPRHPRGKAGGGGGGSVTGGGGAAHNYGGMI